MNGSYRQCSECGKRALSIATRCPGCGREFPAPAAPEGSAGWAPVRLRSPSVLVGVLAAAAVLTTAGLGRSSRSLDNQPLSALADSSSTSSEVGYAPTATARPDAAGADAAASESAGGLLVARTWTHVRRSRSTRANLEAMLTPGDTVLADSLERSWYRVALDGEVLGYVHRSTLTEP